MTSSVASPSHLAGKYPKPQPLTATLCAHSHTSTISPTNPTTPLSLTHSIATLLSCWHSARIPRLRGHFKKSAKTTFKTLQHLPEIEIFDGCGDDRIPNTTEHKILTKVHHIVSHERGADGETMVRSRLAKCKGKKRKKREEGISKP